MNKKGQGALEYLMTYGWALLVIVVVGAALFALGVLNPSTYVQKQCRGFNFFNYQDQQLTQTNFTLQVINGAQNIDVDQIEILGDPTPAVLTPVTMANEQGDAIVSASQGQKMSMYALEAGDDPTTKTSGSSYTYTVKITYDVIGGIQDNVDQATCSGRVQ